MVYGKDIGDVLKDDEGMANMRNIGQNMAWLIRQLKKIAISEAKSAALYEQGTVACDTTAFHPKHVLAIEMPPIIRISK